MSSTLYLHIGTPKTGTSAIQLFMFSNRNALEKNGCYVPNFKMKYPGIGQHRNAHWLIPAVKNDSDYNANLSHLKKIAEEYKTIYMSDEAIWNTCGFKPTFWEGLKKDLINTGIELKVIVYLRRQDSYLYSYWAEQVRRGRVLASNIREYRATDPRVMRHLNYYKYIRKGIMPQIDLSNISIGIYERNRFSGENGIIEDFLDRLGHMSVKADYQMPQRSNNISLRDVVLEVRAKLNQIDEYKNDPEYINALLLKVQSRLEDEGRLKNRNTFFLNNREHFMEKFSGSNGKVASMLLGREDGTLFEDMKVEASEKAEFSTEEIVLVCGYLIQEMQKGYFKKVRNDAVKKFFK